MILIKILIKQVDSFVRGLLVMYIVYLFAVSPAYDSFTKTKMFFGISLFDLICYFFLFWACIPMVELFLNLYNEGSRKK